MNKVTTINLNGKAFQIEEAAYTELQGYLEQATKKLEGNPDKEEIIADLEQAIGEKCSKFLNPHKNVVSAEEIKQVLKEMGPVDGPKTETNEKKTDEQETKRLYQIREGAMISGVCMGLAAYFNLDVTLVRIIFVALAIITHGAWIAVYFIMSLIVPHANTTEEKAAAYGAPFNAQELMNRARDNWGYWNKKEWKKNWKNEQKKWKERRKYEEKHYHHNHSIVEQIIGMIWIAFFVILAIIASHHTTEINNAAQQFAVYVKEGATWIKSTYYSITN